MESNKENNTCLILASTHIHMGTNTPTRAQQLHMGTHTCTLAYTVIQIVCAYTYTVGLFIHFFLFARYWILKSPRDLDFQAEHR